MSPPDVIAALRPPVHARMPVAPPRERQVRARLRPRVLGEVPFKDALVRERKRADRLGPSFAVAVVEASHGSFDRGAWVSVVRATAAVRREVDVIGWLEDGAVLGLLLPETAAKTAERVTERLRDEVAALLGQTPVSIRLYAQPGHPPDHPDLPSVDLLLEAFVEPRRNAYRDAVKCGLDVAGSIALLVLFAPVLAAIVLVLKWASPGSVLFRQTRVGRNGQPFTMLKFRTMEENASDGIHQDYMTWFIRSSGRQPRTGKEVFKLTDDPRVTRIGRFLRRTSLDELPQFWNVLRGDMSLVGPRPPLPFEVAQYQPWHRRRVLEAKPGVTGLWQVRGRSRTTFDEMVRMDLRYARTCSLWTDLKILAATPAAMLFRKGAC